MAVGDVTTTTTARLVFSLSRGNETTTRAIEIPYPKTNLETDDLQNLVDSANTQFATESVYRMNQYIQPLNWRDTNVEEEQWTTTKVHYELVTVTTTPIEPTEPEPDPDSDQSDG